MIKKTLAAITLSLMMGLTGVNSVKAQQIFKDYDGSKFELVSSIEKDYDNDGNIDEITYFGTKDETTEVETYIDLDDDGYVDVIILETFKKEYGDKQFQYSTIKQKDKLKEAIKNNNPRLIQIKEGRYIYTTHLGNKYEL